MSVRVRFPPSPTGHLHVGGARTALFNWLFARQQGGIFVLRIEDTDRARSDEAHVEGILRGLRWLGLDWDEGPNFQSRGVERHRGEALRLLEEGRAYRDFTDPAELRAEAEARGVGHPSVLARARADAMGADEASARAGAGEPHALRLRVPEGETRWHDLVHGEMAFANADLDDLVILRGDGSPIYNLAVVSDDAHEGITHVIRGDDHISNTPKQILLYEALGYDVPTFGHLPMILGPDGKRLSKRHGATAVDAYEGQGILADAMVNFLALLGWNPGDEREVMERAELVRSFDLARVQKKSAVFDVAKLQWLNGQYLARTPASTLLPAVRERLAARADAGPNALEDAWLLTLIDLLKPRARTLDDMAKQAVPFLVDDPERDDAAVAKHWQRAPDDVRERLTRLRARLADTPWEPGPLEEALRALASELEVGAGKLIHPLRVALTGQSASPGIFDVLVLLGPKRALERLDRAIAWLGTEYKTLS
jgi:glutamyl-tRNA synthetase